MAKQTLHERKTIKAWREDRDISQMELARRTGASLSAIQGMESGRTEPRIGMAQKVAAALDVTLDEVEWPHGDPEQRAKRRQGSKGK